MNAIGQNSISRASMNAPNYASGYDDVMCITMEDHVFQDLHINIITIEHYMIHV